MKFLENERLTNINKRLDELEAKKAKLETELNEMLDLIEQAAEQYAIGEIGDKEYKKAESLLKAKSEEIADVEKMIEKVKGVKKAVLLQSLPIVKQYYKKKEDEARKAIEKEEAELLKAKKAFLMAIYKYGEKRREINNKLKKHNFEVNELLHEIGESEYFGNVGESVVIGNTFYKPEQEMIGLSEQTQRDAFKGNLPDWVKGESK